MAFFRRIKCDFNLLATLGGVETPLILVQPVAVIDVGTRTAAAADVCVFAITAFTFKLWIAEGIEDIGPFPQIDEACVADIPGRQRHVGAWGQLAIRCHTRVVGAGEAAAPHIPRRFGNRGVRIFLVREPFEMRRTAGPDEHALVIILTVDQVAKHLFILGRGDVGELFAAAGADHEEDIEYLGAKLVRPIDHRRQFLVIRGLCAEMHLEG